MNSYNEQMIVNMLRRNPAAVERAIIAIHKRQTPDEQQNGETVYRNSVGYSAADAKKAARWVSWLARQERLGIVEGNRFTGSFKAEALQMAMKYRRQLADIANEKALEDMDVAEDQRPTIRMIRVA